MVRWLSFFAEYSFRVEYKPGKLNVLADALSRHPDYELAHVSRVSTDLYDRIRETYRDDESLASLVRYLAAGKDAKVEWLTPRQKARSTDMSWQKASSITGWSQTNPLVSSFQLKYDILTEAHDAPSSGHLGCEKTFAQVSNNFWWAHMSRKRYLPGVYKLRVNDGSLSPLSLIETLVIEGRFKTEYS